MGHFKFEIRMYFRSVSSINVSVVSLLGKTEMMRSIVLFSVLLIPPSMLDCRYRKKNPTCILSKLHVETIRTLRILIFLYFNDIPPQKEN